jgi:hypothetical protein
MRVFPAFNRTFGNSLYRSNDRFDSAFGTDAELSRRKEVRLERSAENGLGTKSVNEFPDSNGPNSTIRLLQG